MSSPSRDGRPEITSDYVRDLEAQWEWLTTRSDEQKQQYLKESVEDIIVLSAELRRAFGEALPQSTETLFKAITGKPRAALIVRLELAEEIHAIRVMLAYWLEEVCRRFPDRRPKGR